MKFLLLIALLFIAALVYIPTPTTNAQLPCTDNPDFCIIQDGVTFCFVCNGGYCQQIDRCLPPILPDPTSDPAQCYPWWAC